MTAIVEWAQFLPLVLSLVALIYAPGYSLATIFNAGPFVVRVVAAPAWTFAFVGLTSMLMHRFGVIWSRYSYATVLLVLAVIASARRAMTWRSRPRGMERVWRRTREVLPKALGVLGAWLVTIMPVIATMGPRFVMQGPDAPYHYNQIWLMARTGNADPLSANEGLLGLSDGRSYYPNVWHSLGALIDFHSQYALVAGNTLLLMAPLVWIGGIAVLCQQLFPENTRSWLWAIAATFLLPAFPLRLELIAGVWPYVMGVAAVPGVMAWLLEIARDRRVSWRKWLERGLVGIIPLIGLAMAHPAAVGVVFWAAAVLAVWFPAQWAVSAHARGEARKTWLFAAAGVAICLAVISFLVAPGPQQSQFGRYPERGWEYLGHKLVVMATLRLKGTDLNHPIVLVYVAVVVLSIIGLSLAWRSLRTRWLCPLWLGFMGALLGSLVSIPVLTNVASLHYANSYRVVGTCAIVVAPLLVLAMSHLATLMARRLRLSLRTITFASVAAIVSLAAVLTWPIERDDLQSGVWPKEWDEPRYSFDEAELAMIVRLRHKIPPERLVLGDPAAGTAFLPAVSDIKVAWYYMGWSFSDPDGEYLSRHFSDIRTDPRVCQIVRRHHIHYFYADHDTMFNGAYNSELRPGLYNVDVSDGFTPVDRGGSAAVYRIDLCWTPDEQ